MLSLNRILVILLTIICFSLAFTSLAQAHEDRLGKIPWPKGEKVPCRCDILAIPYDLCLKGIGREECFKKEKPKSHGSGRKKDISTRSFVLIFLHKRKGNGRIKLKQFSW